MISDKIKYCCFKCFSEEEIQKVIEKFNEIDVCDYCSNKEVDVAPVEEVGEFALKGFFEKI